MFGLLCALLGCHYVADFCLTTPRMIEAKAKGDPWMPIVGHASVHAVLMGGVMCLFGFEWLLCLYLACFQLVTHFSIDLAKGLLTGNSATLADNTGKPFWMLYGLDQLLHLIAIVMMVAVLFPDIS